MKGIKFKDQGNNSLLMIFKKCNNLLKKIHPRWDSNPQPLD